jgi:SAM-dependent methyltransferase
MHRSVKEYVYEFLHEVKCFETDIIEVGSRNVNGTIKDYIKSLKPKSYIGVDMIPGRDVDVVASAENLTNIFGKEKFDIVISTEMLEHCSDWKKVINEMFLICKNNGMILLTARGPGFKIHSYPCDYWRFTIEDMCRVFSENNIINVKRDPMAPGVFIILKKTSSKIFTDFDAVSININKG